MGGFFGGLIALLTLTGLYAGAYYGLPFLLAYWANFDFLHTKPKEGTGSNIVRGKSHDSTVIRFKGRHLNDPRWLKHKDREHLYDHDFPAWEVLPNRKGLTDDDYDFRRPYERRFGIYWVGIPGMKSVHRYKFAWNQHKEEKKGDKFVEHRDEWTSIFKLSVVPYVMILKDNVTRDNVPVRSEATVLLQINNPYTALFVNSGWLAIMESYTDRAGKNHIGSFTYNSLKSETHEESENEDVAPAKGKDGKELDENFSVPMIKLSTDLSEMEGPPKAGDEIYGTKDKVGVSIRGANLEIVQLTGEAARKYEELSTARFEAQMTGQALVITAERQATVTKTTADAAAYARRAAADADAHATNVTGAADATAKGLMLEARAKQPDMAKAELMAEAMKGSNSNVVVQSDLLESIARIAKR